MKPHPLAILGDAAILIGLAIALFLGADVRIIVGAWLLIGAVSKVIEAFNATMAPVVDALKRMVP